MLSTRLQGTRELLEAARLAAEALVEGNGLVAQGSPSSPAALQAVEKPQGQ
jgi:hypothetical protein